MLNNLVLKLIVQRCNVFYILLKIGVWFQIPLRNGFTKIGLILIQVSELYEFECALLKELTDVVCCFPHQYH